ncbi:MAG: type II secretion system protein [Thermodesulfobacteriota bacterium]|nr:type II secretion system protein [Thermodesulfobacteriota bacterium]
MRKKIKSLKNNFKRLGIKNSELRTPNSELLVKNKGFTLIEVIVLIVMAGILLPAIIVPFVTSIKGSQKPEMVTTAMYLVHQRMEEMMKCNYGRSILNPIVLTPYTDIDAVNFPGYQWQWEIKRVQPNATNGFSDSTLEGYKQILVRVRDPALIAYEVYSVVTFFP